MARKMKDSGIEWIGEIPEDWEIRRTKTLYTSYKDIVGDKANYYERLALTLKGVIRRDKEDNTGLQPKGFNGYQVLRKGELVFKLIDLENISTSRVGLSPFTGIVSPAYIILTPKNEILAKFGLYFFFSLWQRAIFNRMGDDGVRSSLNLGDLMNTPHCCTDLSEQQRIADFLDTKCAQIDEILQKTRDTIAEYKKLKQSVITQAVTKGVRGERPMKDSGIEWIGEIPEEWEISKIKYGIIKVGSGKTPLGGAETYIDNGILFLRSQNIYNTGLVFNSVTYISEETDEEMKNTRVLPNDVLLNITGGSIGRCCLFPKELHSANVNQHVSIIRVNNDIFSAEYIHYYWMSYIGQTIIDLYQTGGNREGFSAEAIKQSVALFLSVSEQQEIAQYLDEKCAEIDKLIEKKEQLVNELESYKKSLIYEYVTGKKEVLS